jgi:acyl-CoA synthetase (AMP-forming)/AMP-acid ligase II
MTSFVAASARLVEAATGRELGGSALHAAIGAVHEAYDRVPAGVVFARVGLRTESILHYLGAIDAGRAVALLDPALAPDTLTDLLDRYQPAAVVGLDRGLDPALDPGRDQGPAPEGYRAVDDRTLGPLWRRLAAPDIAPHPDLSVLLATSGSTGSPKLVRLSHAAVLANARSIVAGLDIDEREIAPTSLPVFYSYGLSVLNSHLVAGATVVVADGGVLSRDFWRAVDDHKATSLAGVPHHYEMLARIRWRPQANPSLRRLTQAGGKMRVDLARQLHDEVGAVGGRLFVMYGQTEATARIAILPPDRLPDKLGSAGLPVAGGQLSVRDGEIVYRGANVMMGYAETATDLARGDDLGGVLDTGDLGHLDGDGFLYLTGRVKRIGKVFGVRVNLDDIERFVEAHPVAAVAAGDRIVVWCAGADDGARREVASLLARRLRLHPSGFDVRHVDRLPTLSSGKVDYQSLTAQT